MRDGVVWDFDESRADGNHNSQNELSILHDAPVAGQDFDETGASARTFSVYLHGKKGSVTAAFGSTPVKEVDNPSPGTPKGTRVRRGQVIMRADDTGRSAYNHLHVTVEPMKADGSGPDDYTIPFVFGDADLAGDDGVPRSGVWYDSDNVKVP